MNMSTQRGFVDELPEPLKSVVESIAGAQLDELRMDSYLSSLKERQLVQKSPQSSVESKLVRRPVLIWLASTAALIAMVFGLQFLPTASALEQIASALANVQCIKSTIIVDGVESERWLMLKENRSATRNKQWIDFADGPSNRLLTYDRINGELVQSTLPERVPSPFDTDLIASLARLGAKNGQKTIAGMAVESSEVKAVDGHRVLQLVLRKETISGSARITLQDNGNLPVFGVVQFSRDGLSQTIEAKWEYPLTGPADIFALGVSQDTPVIDRNPTPAIRQLVADVYKGRLQFDDYRAVVFATQSETLHDIDAFEVSLVSKKANRLAILRNADSLTEFRGRNVADVAADLLKNPNSIKWQPATLIHGQDVYRFSMEIADDPGVKATLSYRVSRKPNSPEFFTCPSSHRAPNLVGRPATGVGSPATGASIVSNQVDGPEGCIQLRTVSTAHWASGKFEKDDSSVGQRITSDYWIDATKEALVIEYRTQMDDRSTNTYTLSELTRSPGGHWFPKIATHTNSVTLQNTIYRYFIDFSSPLPDTMFDPNQYVEAGP
jgi:hypothetical protein